MRKYVLTAITMFIACSYASAQGAYDVYQYSFNNRSFTTARVAAMGGAFTSLGADPSAMMINPAGLGLYRSSEISFTPSIRTTVANSNTGINTKTNTTKFNLNNFNAIFSFAQNENRVVRGITIGIGYNVNAINTVKINSNAGIGSASIADYYTNQLNGAGVPVDKITMKPNNNPFFNYPGGGLWGAIDAFNNGLIKHDANGYYLGNNVFDTDEFSYGHTKEQKGRNETYDISLGMQLGNYISVGFSMGLGAYSMRMYNDYYETATLSNTGEYDAMDQFEEIKTNGISFDFRVGIIAQPVEGWRIGAAYHAPRSTRIYESYLIDQKVYYLNGTSSYTQSEIRENEYKMVSPSKFLAGTSYVIKGLGIISVDYERVWYNYMEIKDIGDGGTVNQYIKSNYRATDAIYFGAEFHVGYNIFLRGGFNYASSPFENHKNMDGYDESSIGGSGGIGYRGNSFYVDVAYIYTGTKHQQYAYYDNNIDSGAPFTDNLSGAPIAKNKVNSHIVTMTLGWRF